jgi:hypothetical protein
LSAVRPSFPRRANTGSHQGIEAFTQALTDLAIKQHSQHYSQAVLCHFETAAQLTTRERGTLTGAGLGASAGTLIGSTVGEAGAGAAIGGALGVIAGAATSDQLAAQGRLLEAQQRKIEALRAEVRRQREELEATARGKGERWVSSLLEELVHMMTHPTGVRG